MFGIRHCTRALYRATARHVTRSTRTRHFVARRQLYLNMKNLPQLPCPRTIIRVARHQLLQVRPPPPANLRPPNRLPPRLILDHHIPKQLPRLHQQKNRIILHPMLLQHRLQLRPDRIMPPRILRLATRVHTHHKSFAYHVPPYQPTQRHAKSSCSTLPAKKCMFHFSITHEYQRNPSRSVRLLLAF